MPVATASVPRPALRAAALLPAVLALAAVPLHAQQRALPVDTAITTEHTVTIEGTQVPYRATAGTQPVWNDKGEPIASLFYVYYERTDVQDRVNRPLVISFNGGPGTGSLWMQIGYTGPRHVNVDSGGFPIEPYGTTENPHSILDVADIVYVNPVNTSFSRVIGDTDPKQFFGVQEDIGYLADWLVTFVSRHDRWNSPKFLIGESYGTTRVSGLARELQDGHWMYINGVVLVSPTGLGVARDGPVSDVLGLPNYTATAWYHKALAPELQSRDLEELLAEVEKFTIDEYLPAVARGGSLDDATRQQIAQRVARYSGLPEKVVLDNNLAVNVNLFRKELLRDRGVTVGRLDARYTGRDRQNAGESYDYDPALTSWNHAFAPAINHYLRDELGFHTDLEYYVFGPVRPWNRTGDTTGEDLRQAMAENPVMHLFVQSGYFDGGTDYFSAKYTMWNMDPGGRLRDRMQWKGYPSGHMIYIRNEILGPANQDLRDFIRTAVTDAAEAAKY